MDMSLMKGVALCCVIILTTATKEVAKDKSEQDEDDKYISRKHALVALDPDVLDDKDSDHTSTESFIDENAEIFIPTHEWQAVKPGQSIPSGLHVRLNLQTGEREAKLLDDDDGSRKEGHYHPTDSSYEELNQPSKHQLLKDELKRAMREIELEQNEDTEEGMKYWKQKDREGMINLKKPSFTKEELKEALKKFKVERDGVQDTNEVAEESSKKKFRTMDEIREDFRKLNVDMKTDLEILTGIMSRFKSKDITDDDRVALLTELEYHVHQIDNAQNFADMGGFNFLVRDLNSSSEEVRREAALVVASAVQSNPKVQVSAIESGAMQKLIRMFSTEASTAVRIRVLAALSSLIRSFPYAQHKFLELGGLDALSLLLKQPEVSEKLCIKAVTLVNDLLVEQFSAQVDEHISSVLREEKLSQYSRIPLMKSVVEQGWCNLVPKLLDLSDHDAKEKVLSAMWTLRDQCHRDFVHVLPRLIHLRQEYTEYLRKEMEENAESGEDTYFSSVLQHNIDPLLDFVKKIKEEL